MKETKLQSEVFTTPLPPLARRLKEVLMGFFKDRGKTKFLLIAGFAALLLTAAVSTLIFINLQPKSTEKVEWQEISPSKLKNRSGPLYGVNGVIGSIQAGSNGEKTIILKSDLGVDYQATLSSNTAVFTVSRQLTEKEVKTTRVKIKVEELKTGARIYLQSNKDLIEKREISSGEIRSIEVYIDNG